MWASPVIVIWQVALGKCRVAGFALWLNFGGARTQECKNCAVLSTWSCQQSRSTPSTCPVNSAQLSLKLPTSHHRLQACATDKLYGVFNGLGSIHPEAAFIVVGDFNSANLKIIILNSSILQYASQHAFLTILTIILYAVEDMSHQLSHQVVIGRPDHFSDLVF